MRGGLGAVLVMASLLWGHTALAQQEVKAAEEAPGPWRKALNVGAALVPGLLVHGSGHFVAGEEETGRMLLAAEGGGLLLAVGGIAGLAGTGASDRLVSPFVGMAVAGVGLFGVSGLADLYGVLAPRGGFGVPQRLAPRVSVDLGYRHVFNPVFVHRHFTRVGGRARWRRFGVAPSLWLALDDDNWRARLPATWRFIGADADAMAADGTFLDLEVAYVHHRYGREAFSQDLGELSLAGRLDLVRLAPTLEGAFTELCFGVGYGATTFDGIATEGADLLLARFAFGVYLGRSASGWGELSLYYDHRHDDFAAGLKAEGLGSGAAGHFGVALDTSIYGPWGLSASVEIGSALVMGLSAVYRHGGER